ncbi:unnamed protein product, partial [Adineta steineri]
VKIEINSQGDSSHRFIVPLKPPGQD